MDYSNGIGKIISNEEVAPRHFRMEVEAPFDLKDASAGRFVMLKVSDGLTPILRRPFGIYRVNHDRGSFEILYRVVGGGTRLLSEMAAGVELDILGPLGNGFDLDISGDKPLLVAGGVGVPPLFILAQSLVEKGVDPAIIIGGRSSAELLSLEEFRKLGLHPFTATEDGSEGHKGFVTGVMEELLYKDKATSVYSCGPEAMLKRVGEIALERGIPCQLSLEAIMACGFGVCLGCVIKTCTKDDGTDIDYSRVCCEGPVFSAEEIVWDEA